MHFKYLCDRYQIDLKGAGKGQKMALDLAEVCVAGGQNGLATQLVQAVRNIQKEEQGHAGS